MQSLDSKDPAEAYAVEFRFYRVLDAITSAACTVSLLSGADASPSSLLAGPAQISGTSVYQRVSGGTADCVYKIRCEATCGAETYVLTASMGVVPA